MKIKNKYFLKGDQTDFGKRMSKLIDFLYENGESKVCAGDLYGYICGYIDITSDPEDEIEIFE